MAATAAYTAAVVSAAVPGAREPRVGAGQVVLGAQGDQSELGAIHLAELYRFTDPALSELRLDRLLDELLVRIRQILRVDTAAILLHDRDSAELVARAAKGLEEEVRQGVRIPVGKGFAGRIASERVPIFIADVDHGDVLNPILREKGIRSLLGVPLVAQGSLVGVMHVGTLRPRNFTPRDAAVLELAGARAAPAIERAHIFEALEREHLAATALQRSLLPGRLPEFVEVEVAARYLPAVDEVGGDWYDVLALPRGQVGLMIGDVMGHGVRSAALMGHLRAGMRAYALEGHPPAVVLDLLNRLMTTGDERGMATAAYGVFSPDDGVLRLASAGHPPPLVVSDTGARFVELDPQPPVGSWRPTVFREAEIPIGPGEAVLFYTDGLVESRRVPLEAGMQRLRAAAGAVGPFPSPLCALADGLLTARPEDAGPEDDMGPEDMGPEDDVAVLAMRNVPVPERLSLRLPADRRVLVTVRAALRRWLRAAGARTEETYDIVLAAGEACANAVEHAYGPRGGSLELEASRDGQDVVVVVRDAGRWREPRQRDRGRGIGIMRSSMDSVDHRHANGGTEVVLRRRIANAGEPAGFQGSAGAHGPG
jgi:anti-sigma regulatory factor (Ser/Thr protein kinase)/GAF domain-containing protein